MPVLNMKRRRFIGQSITGGLVAALGVREVSAQASGEQCGFISKADWLVNGFGFVSQISTEAFSKLVSVTAAQLVTYRTAFDDLYCLLNALNAELAKTSATAQPTVTRLQTLAHVAQTNSSLVKVALREGENAAPLFLTLAMVSQEVCAQAQNIPAAESELTLSKEAAGILKKILELVNSDRFKNLHKGVATAQSTSDTESSQINKLISTLQSSITNARNAVLLSENPHPKDDRGESVQVNQNAQWQAYQDELFKALEALKTLTVDKGVASSLPEAFRKALPESVMSESAVSAALTEAASANNDGLTAADSLILGLGTCRRERPMRAASESSVRFIKASYTYPPPVDRNAIGNLLWSHCPPGSRDQIDRIDSIVAFVGGWNPLFPEPARVIMIGSALYWANKLYRISCSGSQNLRKLAEGLAKLT